LRFGTEILAACVGALVAGTVALGHPVAILIGEASIDAQRLVIEVEPDGAGLEHLGIGPDDPARALALRRQIAASLVVVDDRGDRIAPGGAAPDGARLDYRLPPTATAASMWIDPGSLLARRGVQLHLGRIDGGRAVRLTPGGNAATLLLDGAPESGDDLDAWRERHRFERLHATVDASETGVLIQVVAPVSIVETWVPLPRASAYAIDVSGAAPALEAFAARLADSVLSGGEPMRVSSVSLLGPADAVAASSDQVAAAGACVVVSLTGAASGDEAAVEWRFFNAAIRRVVMKGVRPPHAEREATTYSPATVWAAERR